jgi:nitroimidazol reductase NimA-like FMN-containing flavoprotein (pyridoxamine 5'-phosphate oxidase superfamily)
LPTSPLLLIVPFAYASTHSCIRFLTINAQGKIATSGADNTVRVHTHQHSHTLPPSSLHSILTSHFHNPLIFWL